MKKINSLCGVEVSDLRKSDDERDLRLVNDSDKIIAYLRPQRRSSGTAKNLMNHYNISENDLKKYEVLKYKSYSIKKKK